jgi:DNA end-binding protein Ku
MARAMWKGAIQFGLVTIPVKLYTATESGKTISFNMLHKADLTRIQMKVFCPTDDAVISRTDTVRGYEYAPDQYVVITDEDLESVPLKTMRAIEIQQFVERQSPSADLTRFVERAYYIEPDPIGRKAFALLKSVLMDKGLTAIAKVVIKDREDLAAIEPFGSTMLLTTIKWPDEIRSLGDLDLPSDEPEFKPAERRMAEQLVAAMTSEFDPAEYRDEYRDALLKVIEAKVDGAAALAPQRVEEPTRLVDLMAALEASVEAARRARPAVPEPVSVAAARSRGGARASARSAAAAPAQGERAAVADPAPEEARPARRRKSA